MQLSSDDVAFVLGRNGTTKRKIARVAQCELELDSSGRLEMRGPAEARERAREYVEYVLAQRVGAVYMDLKTKRGDMSLMEVPTECIGYVTGKNGVALRSHEDEFGTLMFFVRDVSQKAKDDEVRGVGIHDKTLAIFGSRRDRAGAMLKVMSAIEHKLPNHYTIAGARLRPEVLDHLLELFTGDGADFQVKEDEIVESEFSYALGRNGTTRKKLAAAAHCVLQYIGRCVVFAGTEREVRLGNDYLRWLMEQRTGAPHVAPSLRDDCTPLDLPSRVIGFVTGPHGATLREIEAATNTFIFTDGDKSERAKDQELLLIFSADAGARRVAADYVHQRVAQKDQLDRGGGGGDRGRSSGDRGGDRGGYGAPPHGYGAPPPHHAYGAPPPHAYGYPPPQAYGAPPGYGAPPPPYGYPAPYGRGQSPPRRRSRSPRRDRSRSRSPRRDYGRRSPPPRYDDRRGGQSSSSRRRSHSRDRSLR